MKKINFQNSASGNTPLNAENLNQMQENIEESCVIVSSTEPTTGEKVWFKKGRNLFDKSVILRNVGIDIQTGKAKEWKNRATSNYINVNPGQQYTLSKNGVNISLNIFEYNSNKEFIKVTSSSTITVTSSAAYIRFYGEITQLDSDLQFEQGNVATAYEAYIEPKIYVLNNNGAYEEFLKKEEKLIDYKTIEQKIGTWIDGKPLYRKVVSGTVPQTTAGTSTGVNIDLASNIDMCIIEFAYFIIYGNQVRPIPFLESATQTVRCWYLRDPKQLRILNNFQDASNCPVYISILYTKTTDV